MNKNINTAQYSGFCHGVKRAVETAIKIKSDNKDKNVYVLGELIHNSVVINELENLGIHTVETLPSCNSGICIIRSHGMPLNEIENIKNKGFQIADLTCPDVKKVQNMAIQIAINNIPLLIVGKKEHPEVIAIKANALLFSDKVFVISSPDELNNISQLLKNDKKAGIVVQTTQKIELLNEIILKVIPFVKDLQIYNTICKSTTLRQNAARELAEKSDLMIVAGSKKSANTTHLYEIIKNITASLHVESADDLDKYIDIIEKSNNIGITAGASTPQKIIDEIINKIQTI